QPIRVQNGLPTNELGQMKIECPFGVLGDSERMDAVISTFLDRKLTALRVLAAGLAAMAFFRTSLFTAKVGDQDLPLGPGIILQILLNVTDRQVDRGRARPRAQEIAEIMADVDFLKARKALPPLCFGLMQNVSPEEQKAIADQVNLIEQPKPGEASRLQSILLGLLLLNVVGAEVLKAAIAAVKQDVQAPPPPPASA
ncbi:MAG: hypothetical protein ACJ8DZ_08190, partial [Allosphingosinicella sp.]